MHSITGLKCPACNALTNAEHFSPVISAVLVTRCHCRCHIEEDDTRSSV